MTTKGESVPVLYQTYNSQFVSVN